MYSKCNHVQSCTAHATSVQPCTTMYSHVQPCTAMYSHVQPCTAMYNHVQPCTTMCNHVQHVHQRATMYSMCNKCAESGVRVCFRVSRIGWAYPIYDKRIYATYVENNANGILYTLPCWAENTGYWCMPYELCATYNMCNSVRYRSSRQTGCPYAWPWIA